MEARLEDWKKKLLVLLALALCLSVSPAFSSPVSPRGCAVCHGKEAKQLDRSIHTGVPLSCTSCHEGNDGPVNKEEAHGDTLRILDTGRKVVELCGNCHSDLEKMRFFGVRTDQLALYKTSLHGKRLFENDDAHTATCVDCHGAHDILPPSDPRAPTHLFNQAKTCGRCHSDPELMKPYGLRTDIVELYKDSVHGKRLQTNQNTANPSCSSCHGSHGAAPPRVDKVATVCGHCHSVIRGSFEESPHLKAVESGAMEECVSCHGDHGVQEPGPSMFLGDEEGHCGFCHDGDEGEATAKALHRGIEEVQADLEMTEEDLRAAARESIFIEDEEGYLDEVNALIVRSRAKTHTVTPEILQESFNRTKAMLRETRSSLELKTRWLRDRKIFTAVFFLVVLVFTACLLAYQRTR